MREVDGAYNIGSYDISLLRPQSLAKKFPIFFCSAGVRRVFDAVVRMCRACIPWLASAASLASAPPLFLCFCLFGARAARQTSSAVRSWAFRLPSTFAAVNQKAPAPAAALEDIGSSAAPRHVRLAAADRVGRAPQALVRGRGGCVGAGGARRAAGRGGGGRPVPQRQELPALPAVRRRRGICRIWRGPHGGEPHARHLDGVEHGAGAHGGGRERRRALSRLGGPGRHGQGARAPRAPRRRPPAPRRATPPHLPPLRAERATRHDRVFADGAAVLHAHLQRLVVD